jgi:hypothetical protein
VEVRVLFGASEGPAERGLSCLEADALGRLGRPRQHPWQHPSGGVPAGPAQRLRIVVRRDRAAGIERPGVECRLRRGAGVSTCAPARRPSRKRRAPLSRRLFPWQCGSSAGGIWRSGDARSKWRRSVWLRPFDLGGAAPLRHRIGRVASAACEVLGRGAQGERRARGRPGWCPRLGADRSAGAGAGGDGAPDLGQEGKAAGRSWRPFGRFLSASAGSRLRMTPRRSEPGAGGEVRGASRSR